ncbi:hypothetical protein RZS08_31300, partial [Arthrospira platensis SPKY1]|nr:hypothetical protein [Arthrospira platensis SPKY1]
LSYDLVRGSPIKVSLADAVKSKVVTLDILPGSPSLTLSYDPDTTNLKISGSLLTMNKAQFLKLRDNVLPSIEQEFTLRDGKRAVDVTSRPKVSTGFVEIDTTKISPHYLTKNI